MDRFLRFWKFSEKKNRLRSFGWFFLISEIIPWGVSKKSYVGVSIAIHIKYAFLFYGISREMH